tara:strand:+ start:1601 stop:6820 length:5220 start_codon:yes stop_codon:yes gene_type:complete
MPEIKNNFLKGRMNQDLDSRILPQGEYREAINLLISRSEGATVGEFENILGNTNRGTISATKQASVIGHFVDETNNNVYIFATDFSSSDKFERAASTNTCLILEFDLDPVSNGMSATVNTLVSGHFLNFNKNFPIYGVNLLEELLFWTDNLNQPRRINITTAKNDSSAYTKEVQISVAKYYPYDPIIPLTRNTGTTTSGGTSTQIKLTTALPNVKVGDIVTDNDKTDFANLKIGNSLPPVRVTKIVNTDGTDAYKVFNVSPAISTGALASGIKIDFSRTSMENQSDNYVSNYSTQTIDSVLNSGSGITGGSSLLSYVTAGPGIGGAATDATPGTYTGTPGVTASFTTTSANGAGIEISVTIGGLGGISAVTWAGTGTNNGTGWVAGDDIKIAKALIGGSTNIIITLTSACIDTATVLRIDDTTSGGTGASLGGLPRVLDIFRNITSPNNIPNPSNTLSAYQYNLRLAELVVTNVSTTDPGRWALTLDGDATAGGNLTGFTPTDSVLIGYNELYDSSFTGDKNYLDDKFVRFSYRFKFNDNEESLMAPFSQIMFVPKQYGQFGLGQIEAKLNGINNYYQDEVDAYTSTILQWFENDIDTIALKIPLPDTLSNLQSIFNINQIEILYKESDAQAIKVLDTIDVDTISSTGVGASLILKAGGTGYTGATDVATTGGTGTGLTIDTTVSGGVVTNGAINQPGNGYTNGDVVTVSGGGSNAQFIVTVNADTTTIQYDDEVQGLTDKLFFNYQYQSAKPYKVLPEGDTVRVYDKVPIRALAQEIITNRIVYGNYVEKMTPPNDIPYSIGFTDRNAQASDFVTEYPYSNIKQNRTYQVGFVLSDYFGRQSDVILSSFDIDPTKSGSSVYVPYRTVGSNSDATASPVIDWLGKNLTVNIESAIGETINNTLGKPGIYKEDDHVASIITITDDDSDYEANTTYATSGGSGSGCTVRVTSVGAGGEVASLAIISSGSGYTQGNELTILGGGGSGTFTVNVGESNPLGWYSYKIVVKQQEQEYYNVFFPGLINGLPINNRVWDGELGSSASATDISSSVIQRGKIAFSSLIGDNINKIPRNLKEVGPTDSEFNSEETLYFRVNNPNATSTLGARNLQYDPGQKLQNVLNISPNSEVKLAPVPFVPFTVGPDAGDAVGTTAGDLVQNGGYSAGNKGEWGSTIRYIPSGADGTNPVIKTTPTGSIPWGDVADAESFYNADQNPYIMKIGQVGNYNNQLGAIVCGANVYGTQVHDTNYADGVRTMRPILSIAETKPVFSRLPIFWETTSSGLLEVLNASINTNDNGAVAMTPTSGTFAESISSGSQAGPTFSFIDGSGAAISNVVGTPSIVKVYRQNDLSQTNINPGYFTVAAVSAGSTYKINAAKEFWYGVSSNNDPSSDIYIFDIEVTSGTGTLYTRTITAGLTLTLTNVAPLIYTDAGYTNDVSNGSYTISSAIAVSSTDIFQLYGLNGSADTTGTPVNRTRELVWELTAIIPGKLGSLSDFSIDSTGLITSNTIMTNEGSYGLTLKVTDVNDTGSNKISTTLNLSWIAGTDYAPKIIGTSMAGCSGCADSVKRISGAVAGSSGEWRWTNDSYALGTVSNVGYPAGWSAATFVYNAQTQYNTTQGASCRADLFQGTIRIKPKLYNTSTAVGDIAISFSIQYRANSGSPWGYIDTAAGSPNTWVAASMTTVYVTKSVTGTGSVEYDYKFDQLGEYRVVTNALTGSGAAVGEFITNFNDGAYGITASGPCNP